jgi:hypothetical protein
MKRKLLPLKKIVTLSFTFGLILNLVAQKEINLTAGVGFPEFLNIGIKGQLKQIALGISVGTVPVLEVDEKILSVCGDLFYHYGKIPELSQRRVWYGRVGMNYLSDKISERKDRYTYLNLRVGRDLNLSEKFGFQIDGGILILLAKKISEHTWIDFPIIPSIGLNFFLRL